MKKVTLIVPDEIQHVIGSSWRIRLKSEDINPENIKKALCDRSDYHEYYHFKSSDKVDVLSIDDYVE